MTEKISLHGEITQMIPRFGDGRDWFFKKRLGLFLHFGLYAIEGWHEQDQMRRFIPRKQYEKLIRRFNPQQFDPESILDLAESVGMGYVCLTTKHHDGFCLWDTACTDFNVMNSPYGKDIVKLLAEECHRRNFSLGLYYSIVDWHHPNYPNQGRSHELPNPEDGDEPNFSRYMEFLKKQVQELCTRYGPVHHFFWDMNVPEHHDPSINSMLRSLQPSMVINDRGFDEGDFATPEREFQTDTLKGICPFTKPTEACNSVGTQSWGYRREEDYYSQRQLIESIDTVLAKGGNYLLNVGPDADGRIPEQPTGILRRIEEWYCNTREAFEGCDPAPELTDNTNVWLTRKGLTLYVHLSRLPISEAVVLNPIKQYPARAVLLNTGQPVEVSVDLLPLPGLWESREKFLRIRHLPVNDFTNQVLVVRLDFERPLEARSSSTPKAYVG